MEIHSTRLNVLKNNTSTWTTENNKCRKCGEKEYLSHILDNCKPDLVEITKRHNLVVDMETVAKTRLNMTIPITTSTARPDIVVFDEERKRCTIVDITCPFDKDTEAIPKARRKK